MTDVEVRRRVERQPFLSDAVIVLSAPSQVWSRPFGTMGEAPIDGVYFADTRFVRSITVLCDGAAPEWISAVPDGASRIVFGGVLRTGDDPTPDPWVRVLRERVVAVADVTETVTVRSHLDVPVRTRLEVVVEPDFAPLTEVKAGLPETRSVSIVLDPAAGADGVLLQSGRQAAVVRAAGADRTVEDGRVVLGWDLVVPARGEAGVRVVVSMADPDAVIRAPEGGADLVAPRVDHRVDRWTQAALADLRALRVALTDHPDEAFFAAGAPWFFTLFGRDSLWAARLSLPAGVATAASTLRVLARLQGEKVDGATAEQPGKILHELRSSALEMPDGLALPPVYYGTVDATALWVCLLHDAWRAGMTDADVRELLPTMRGCLDWIRRYGDSDGDGFLDYRDETGHGLSNQGWKDSGDSIQWRDGSLAEGPIALCEVQGYAYEAAVAGADILDAFGETGGDELREWAAELRERFAEAYWVTTPEGRYPAIALDRDKRAVDTLTSNIGHLLGTGLLDADDERRVADLLVGPSMLSGFGVRTLSTGAAGYWPLSYHGGSVWTHDTAIIARGMHRAGLAEHARRVCGELVAAAEGFSFRVPELHAGDPATETSVPTPYPAACRPQAWAAAAAITVADILATSAEERS